MKIRNIAFVFILIILSGVCFTTCQNPIMEDWWDEGGGGGGGNPNVGIFNWGKYKVTFDMNGGKYVDERTPRLIDPEGPIPPQFIEAGKWVMDPGLAENGALAFGGWYTAPSGGTRWSFGSDGTPVNSDMTLYVHWGSAGHHVYFREITTNVAPPEDDPIDMNKAVYKPRDELIVHGELATEPLGFGSKVSTVGFNGWYTDKNFTDPWDFQTDTVTGNITLYAQWITEDGQQETEAFTVTWDVNGSPDPVPVPTTVTSGSKVSAPMSITNPGYSFGGWYKGPLYTQEWNFDVDTVTSNITLQAKWTTPGMSGTGTGGGATFTLGGDDPDASQSYPNTSPQPTVTIDRDFYIDQYEVTAAKYKAVTGLSPSRLPAGVSPDEYPVNRVTWFDAIEYCNNLSEKEELEKVYTWTSGPEKVTVGGITFIKSGTVRADLTKNGYRLPTEAEWEYAARGGEDIVVNHLSPETTYAGSNNIDDVAWYDRNAGTVPHPVGLKSPNYLGLYDMSGNVSEWCWDAYHSTIYGNYANATDPANDDNSSKTPLERVRRGGNFNMIDVRIRSRTNNNKNPTFSWPPAPANNDLDSLITLGFRVVRTIP